MDQRYRWMQVTGVDLYRYTNELSLITGEVHIQATGIGKGNYVMDTESGVV